MHSRALALTIAAVALFSSASIARDVTPRSEPIPTSEPPRRAFDTPGTARAMSAVAAANTTVLYAATFNGANCNASGWTAVDMTAQVGDFFHVDDYAGLPPSDFSPLAGTKSLWCGARPQATGPLCGYQTLPGYGNDWDQAFCTRECIPVTGALDISFLMRVDSESDYDATTLEYTGDCSGNAGWKILDGGRLTWDGTFDAIIDTSYTVTGSPVKVRLRFHSDGAWSDEDGLHETSGAVHIDNLQVEGLALEDFEDEAVGTTSSNDWESCTPPGYGLFAGLAYGTSVLQQDPCVRDVSCLWNFFTGSKYNYACGGFPQQKTVPRGNARGQYIWNEIWSPEIALSGTGSELLLEFSVYRDLDLDAFVFYVWHIRGISGGCADLWQDRNYVYFGSQKDWLTRRQPVGDLVDLANASHVQVALGVKDMCGAWCFIGAHCHSHAPLFDNVRLLRIDAVGPRWSIRDFDQFQDNFAGDGTLTGTVRADMASDVAPGANVNSIVPGDSSVVTVADPVEGLGIDPSFGGAAVYCYVSVWPQGQAAKTGAALTGDPSRFPVVGAWTDARGIPWTVLRTDSVHLAYAGGIARADAYCVDLSDNLFTPGDTVCFFYAARSANAVETYAFGSSLEAVGSDREVAALNAAEFTCLPAGGPARGGDILYVDGMDGRGAQPYWDTAFAALGILDKIDRYDVRGPTSRVSNRLGGRVASVPVQLAPYRAILWDCGDLDPPLGGGTGYPDKTDDWGLFSEFLGDLALPGGVYVCGDDVPFRLRNDTAPSAVVFRGTRLPFNVTSGNHRNTFGIAPAGIPAGGGCYSDPFIIFGGCPLLNDFDVMTPTGTSQIAIGYGTPATTNGAVISNTTTNGSANVTALLGGFSFVYIANDDNDGISDRARFLRDTLCRLGSLVAQPTPVTPSYANTLSQNYPNPFNPQTTIHFSLRTRGVARLTIYNVSGERVRVLAGGEELVAGAHTRIWDGRNDAGARVSSGIYFYELVAGDFRQTRKMVLLK